MHPERLDAALTESNPIVMVNDWIPFQLQLRPADQSTSATQDRVKFNPQKSLLVFSDWHDKLSLGKPQGMYHSVSGTLLETCLEHDVFNPYMPFD